VFQDNVSVASEKKGGRQDWEFRTKRLKRRMSSSSDDDGGSLKSDNKLPDRAAASKSPESDGAKGGNSGLLKQDQDVQAKQANRKELSSKEILEAAARAQLRSKFDHVGIDPHSSSAVDRSVPGIPNRGMTSSPPPPGLASAAALSPHGAVSGFARHVGEHQTGDSSSDSTPHPLTVQQNPTPFFSAANDTATPIPAVRANQGMQMLQMHSHSSTVNNPPPLELVVGTDAGGASSGAAAAASSSALSSANVANLDVSCNIVDWPCFFCSCICDKVSHCYFSPLLNSLSLGDHQGRIQMWIPMTFHWTTLPLIEVTGLIREYTANHLQLLESWR
jgi:hypothetical protein